MDGFQDLVTSRLIRRGIPESAIHGGWSAEIPGFFRPEKRWDLVVVYAETLVCAVEFKSLIGSFGNNFNNRTEEALGNATDLWTAHRERAYGVATPPWVGFLLMLEEASGSTTSVGVRETHFPVFEQFRDTSHTERCELLLLRLMSERLYSSTCLITSSQKDGLRGDYTEPNDELRFGPFLDSLEAHTLNRIRALSPSSGG